MGILNSDKEVEYNFSSGSLVKQGDNFLSALDVALKFEAVGTTGLKFCSANDGPGCTSSCKSRIDEPKGQSSAQTLGSGGRTPVVSMFLWLQKGDKVAVLSTPTLGVIHWLTKLQSSCGACKTAPTAAAEKL